MPAARSAPGWPYLAGLSELGETPFQEHPLGVRGDELERVLVGGAGLLDALQAAENLCAGRVQIVVAIEREPVDERQRSLRLARLRERRRVVELDDRRARLAGQLAVERRYLRPVGWLVDVERRDRGLHEVGAHAVQRERAIERRPAARDLRMILRGGRERLLNGFLGEIEIAEEADQGGEDPSPLLPEDAFERRQYSTTGRISTAPPIRAAGTGAASWIALSRSSASSTR
jgi:hypothetical protein